MGDEKGIPKSGFRILQSAGSGNGMTFESNSLSPHSWFYFESHTLYSVIFFLVSICFLLPFHGLFSGPLPASALSAGTVVFPGAADYENLEADTRSSWYTAEQIIHLDTGEANLLRPVSMEFIDDRLLVVVDSGLSRFTQILLPDGDVAGSFGREGNFAGEFSQPEAIICLIDNGFAVADKGNQRIQILDRSFRGIDYFGFLGGPRDHSGFADPVALAVAAGRLYVVDRYNRLIKSYSLKNHTYRTSFGQFRFEPSKSLGDPRAIAIHGNVAAVSDFTKDRVVFFAIDREHRGEYLGATGASADHPLHLHAPLGLDYDFHGNLWVTDSGSGRVLRFDSPAETSKTASVILQNYGQGMKLLRPVDVKVNRRGEVAVLDAGQKQIVFFRSGWFARGREAYEAGKWAEALEPLQRAVLDAERTGTGNVYAMFYLARSLEQLERFTEAYSGYEKLLRTFSFGTVRARAEYRMKVLRPMLSRP